MKIFLPVQLRLHGQSMPAGFLFLGAGDPQKKGGQISASLDLHKSVKHSWTKHIKVIETRVTYLTQWWQQNSQVRHQVFPRSCQGETGGTGAWQLRQSRRFQLEGVELHQRGDPQTPAGAVAPNATLNHFSVVRIRGTFGPPYFYTPRSLCSWSVFLQGSHCSPLALLWTHCQCSQWWPASFDHCRWRFAPRNELQWGSPTRPLQVQAGFHLFEKFRAFLNYVTEQNGT